MGDADVLAVDPRAPEARPVSGALLRYGIGGDVGDEGQVFPFQTWLYDSTTPPVSVSVATSIMAPRSLAPPIRGAAPRSGCAT